MSENEGTAALGAKIYDKKIIVHSLSGHVEDMQAWVEEWFALGVNYVSFVGVDASRLQDDFIDACVMLNIRDGRESASDNPYHILSSFYEGERMDEAMELAFVLGCQPVTPVCIIDI